jgi:hypothetical protein
MRATRLSFAATAALLAISFGCGPKKPLTKERAVELIKSSKAFQGPMDPQISFADTTYRPGPNTKREFVSLVGLTAKADGPFGIAGSTATGAFTWRWTEGPLAGQLLVSKVKFNDNGDGWHIYNDYLQEQLFKAERREEGE